MSIVAFNAEGEGNSVILSLGTDGGKGNTCILTNKKATHQIDVVYAILDGITGQANPPEN